MEQRKEIRTYFAGKPHENKVLMIIRDYCWYSYTHHKYYCKDCHEYDGLDLMESFQSQEALIKHMMMKHKTVITPFTIPSDCAIEAPV